MWFRWVNKADHASQGWSSVLEVKLQFSEFVLSIGLSAQVHEGCLRAWVPRDWSEPWSCINLVLLRPTQSLLGSVCEAC